VSGRRYFNKADFVGAVSCWLGARHLLQKWLGYMRLAQVARRDRRHDAVGLTLLTLERTQRGAHLLQPMRAPLEREMTANAALQHPKKVAIGREAAERPSAGGIVIFDSSSTVMKAVRAAAERDLPLTVATNNLQFEIHGTRFLHAFGYFRDRRGHHRYRHFAGCTDIAQGHRAQGDVGFARSLRATGLTNCRFDREIHRAASGRYAGCCECGFAAWRTDEESAWLAGVPRLPQAGDLARRDLFNMSAP